MTSADVQTLKDQVEKLKLQQQLKKLGGGKGKKKSSKAPRVLSTDNATRHEISELQEKRAGIDKKAEEMKKGKGFFGKLGVGIAAGIAKAKYNQQINQRSGFVNQGRQIQQVKRQTELEKAKAELAKAREQNPQNKPRDFNRVNVEDLFKMP